jgi:large repetitive protein
VISGAAEDTFGDGFPYAVRGLSLIAVPGGGFHGLVQTALARRTAAARGAAVPPGSLPPGLTLNSSTGQISGTPDVAGTYTFTVTVTDSENPPMTASATLSISVSGPVITGLNPDRGPSFGFTPVLITGTGLSCPPGQRGCRVTVTFGQRQALVVLDRPGKIWVLSPAGSGTETVTVTVGGVSSQPTTFTYLRFL